jgi:hypothetical protein
MEDRLRMGAGQGCASLSFEQGDFFGPHSTGNSWFSNAIIKPGKPVKSLTWPGRKGVGHAWAYLPDYGETVARLIDKDTQNSRLSKPSISVAIGSKTDTTLQTRSAARPEHRMRPSGPCHGWP